MLISIVMPSYNQASFIGHAIDSVFAHSHGEIELIISDGGSTDGTLDVIRQKSQLYSGIRWTSEVDDGPADAVNKAFTKVRGEIVGWLNSDDLYTKGTIDRVLGAFRDQSDWILCYGHGEHIDANGALLGSYPTSPPSVGLDGFRKSCFICQPTVFFRTALLTLVGRLDPALKTAFDYDYWMRVFRVLSDRVGFIGSVQARSRLHEDCITQNQRADVAAEGVFLGRKYFGRAEMHWIATHLEELQASTPDSLVFVRRASAFLDRVSADLQSDQLEALRRSLPR